MPLFFKLKKRKDFVRTAKAGVSIPTHTIVIQAAVRENSSVSGARIGYTTTKKIGKAVVRNRCRRRLRAAAALYSADIALPNADYVLIARYNTATVDFQEICRDLRYGVKKLNRQLNGETGCVEENGQTSVSGSD